MNNLKIILKISKKHSGHRASRLGTLLYRRYKQFTFQETTFCDQKCNSKISIKKSKINKQKKNCDFNIEFFFASYNIV